MAAPSASTRVVPSLAPFENGYKTLLTFAADTDVQLWEIKVKPPGIDGGDEIDISTMHNTYWRTAAPRALAKATPVNLTVGYRGGSYSQVKALINVETTITITFPNGSKLAFYGFLKSFEASEHAEGEMPQGSCVVVPTMRDPSTGTEENFTYVTASPGTGS